jgi:hypothetical protein
MPISDKHEEIKCEVKVDQEDEEEEVDNKIIGNNVEDQSENPIVE